MLRQQALSAAAPWTVRLPGTVFPFMGSTLLVGGVAFVALTIGWTRDDLIADAMPARWAAA